MLPHLPEMLRRFDDRADALLVSMRAKYDRLQEAPADPAPRAGPAAAARPAELPPRQLVVGGLVWVRRAGAGEPDRLGCVVAVGKLYAGSDTPGTCGPTWAVSYKVLCLARDSALTAVRERLARRQMQV